MREVTIEPGILNHAEGSCLIKFGSTEVICSASLDENVPRFIKGSGSGWITAEYGMLPRSTGSRMKREASFGKQTGRTQEIQRLIGRAMRASCNLRALGERQILLDCDVINADGGTRTAAITGSYVALQLAIRELLKQKKVRQNPLVSQIAAISCGLYQGELIVDLDYIEDSNAMVDANFVFNGNGKLIEVQGTGEEGDFSLEQLSQMGKLASDATGKLFELQNKVLLDL